MARAEFEPMAITVKCRSCKRKYQVRDTLAGKSVACKECGEPMQVPVAGPGSQPESDDAPAAGYAIRGAASDEPVPAAPAKTRAKPAERVLRRDVASSTSQPRSRPAGNHQMLWIGGGAALAVTVVVILIVTSIGPAPEPLHEIGQIKSSPPQAGPPPAHAPASSTPATDQTYRPARQEPARKSQPVASAVPRGPAEEQSETAASETRVEKTQLSVVTDVGAWEVKVDPPDEPVEIDARKKIYATFPKNATVEVVYPDGPSSLVALGSNKNPREVREIRDVQANRRIGAVRASVIAGARTALSPDGLFFAAWPTGQNRIGVWDVKAERPHGVVTSGENSDPRLLMFAGLERLIAIGNNDELLVWTMPGGEPVGTISLPRIRGSVVAGLTPGGRFLALAATEEKRPLIRVFNLATGDTAGEINFEGFGKSPPVCRGIAFSPDGLELAALCETSGEAKLFVFRVAKGTLSATIRIAGGLPEQTALGAAQARPLEWFPGRKRWLVDGRSVIDRAAGKVVWYVSDEDSQIPTRVLDEDRVLTLGVEKNDAAIVAVNVGRGPDE